MKNTFRPETAEKQMIRQYFVYFLVSALIFSCASPKSSRMGTGRPKFSSIQIEGVSYFLSSRDGTFSASRPVELTFTMKNISGEVKNFSLENRQFLFLQIRNEFREKVSDSLITSDGHVPESFSLMPSEEREFRIKFVPHGEKVTSSGSIYCQVRLFFLPRQFRRTALSIHLDRK